MQPYPFLPLCELGLELGTVKLRGAAGGLSGWAAFSTGCGDMTPSESDRPTRPSTHLETRPTPTGCRLSRRGDLRCDLGHTRWSNSLVADRSGAGRWLQVSTLDSPIAMLVGNVWISTHRWTCAWALLPTAAASTKAIIAFLKSRLSGARSDQQLSDRRQPGDLGTGQQHQRRPASATGRM